MINVRFCRPTLWGLGFLRGVQGGGGDWPQRLQAVTSERDAAVAARDAAVAARDVAVTARDAAQAARDAAQAALETAVVGRATAAQERVGAVEASAAAVEARAAAVQERDAAVAAVERERDNICALRAQVLSSRRRNWVGDYIILLLIELIRCIFFCWRNQLFACAVAVPRAWRLSSLRCWRYCVVRGAALYCPSRRGCSALHRASKVVGDFLLRLFPPLHTSWQDLEPWMDGPSRRPQWVPMYLSREVHMRWRLQ